MGTRGPDRVAIILTALAAAVHLAFADRYDLVRDELYLIVCGQHPAFGYADQPPLVPLLAAAGYALGSHTWVVRLPAVAAAAGLVWLVVAFVRLLGGRNDAAWLGGIAALAAPILGGLTATLNTGTFEPLTWTLVAYALARAAILDDRRALIWGGAVAGVALEAKYGIALWLVALVAGIVVAGPRELLRRRELWLGVGIAAVVALPSLAWQAAYGWPFVELVRNAGAKDVAVTPLAFALNQVLVLNIGLAPMWLAGIVVPFVRRDLRALRFVPIAYAIAAVAIVAGGGKDYYLAPAYPALFALGAVALAALVRAPALRGAYIAVVLVLAAIVAPLALPILDPPALIGYMRALHVELQAQERVDRGALLPPEFADMLGWHIFVHDVARAFAAVPAADRATTSILVDNYGEAAAIDLYGRAAGLPPALSGHNEYFFWGLRGQTARNVLRVQDDPRTMESSCSTVRILGQTQATYARSFENGKLIALCRGLHPPLGTLWPEFKMMI